MNYLAETAAHDEVLIARGSLSWVYTLQAWAALIAGSIAALILLELPVGGGMFLKILALGAFLLGVARYAIVMLLRASTEIAVTNRRIIYKRGWVSRRVDEVAVNRIEGVNVDQSVLGRIFGFGTLQIQGIGIGHLNLPPIVDPLGFRRAIQDAVHP